MIQKYKDKKIIGSDETGVGDYLTPLVASAAFVPLQNIDLLKKLGVTDSKKLTDKNILEIYEKIKMRVKSRTRFLNQSQYNALSKVYNAHELKLLLHIQCINSLEKDINPDLIIIDKFASEKNLDKYYKKLIDNKKIDSVNTKIKAVEKGELEHISVAVASIIARVKLLELMKEQNKKWDMQFPLGTTAIAEEAAVEFIKKHGWKSFNEVAKTSFKTTEKIQSIV